MYVFIVYAAVLSAPINIFMVDYLQPTLGLYLVFLIGGALALAAMIVNKYFEEELDIENLEYKG